MNTNQILRNAASNYGRMIIGIVTTVLLTPFILHRLGSEAYGMWALTLSIAGYFSLTDLGVTNAAVRYIAHYRALQDWTNVNKTIGSTLFCFIGMALVCLLGSVVVSFYAPHWFKVSPDGVRTLRLLILNVGLISFLGFISVLPIQCVIAAQRQDVLNQWSAVTQILVAVLTALGLYLGGGVLVLASLQLLNAAANGIIGYVLSRSFFPQARFEPNWDKEQGKLLVSFASLATLIALASRMIYYTDTLVIASYLSVSAVAGYAIILKITEFLRGLVGAGTGVLGTFVSEQAALNNAGSLALMWSEGTKWSLVIVLPATAMVSFLGPEILYQWIGRHYVLEAIAMTWLCVGLSLDLAQSTAYQILMNSGRHKVLAILMIIEAVSNLTLSILLVQLWGVIGVAIATMIPLTIRSVIFYPLYMPRVTGLSLSEYLRQAVFPALWAAFPAVVLIVLYKYLGLSTNRLSLASLSLVIGVVALLGAYQFCLSDSARAKLHSVIANRLRRKPAGAVT